ncbi:MAG: serine/threonine protein kinase [Deltaproteobacteria bacterium]|nr:serine/threonine protein kinase [Deltaproteobacteria bacterium]
MSQPVSDLHASFVGLDPARVLAAVEAAGHVPSGHCFALNALENRVYDVRLEDGRHVVAKFYRPGRWTRDTILDEHRLLAALVEAEIPVCAPLAFPDGDTLWTDEDVHYALWLRTGGRSPDELRDDQLAVLGRLMARIHAVAADLGAPHRRPLDPEHGPLEALALLEEGDWLPPSCRDRYVAAVERLVAIYRERSCGVAVQPIHGDCHAGNLLNGPAGWFFLDFDDMVIGPAVQDVWMLVPGRDAEADRQRRVLVEAYRTFRDFDEGTFSLIEPLRGFRFVFYAGWIAKRWKDPAFPDAFPHFGTDAYWEDETRDLDELVGRIERGDDLLAPEERAERANTEGEELSNADFFWDM